MQQTAEVIKFERPQVKADIDQGFDRVAGTLTDTLMNPPVKLSAREYQVIHAIISKTYRYHKKSDWVASSQLAELTGISVTNISKIKTGLIRKNIIVKTGRMIGINPIISDWQESKTVKNDCNKNSQKRLAKQSKTTSAQSKTTNGTVKNDNNNRKTILQKTIIQKNIESLPLPSSISKETWDQFIEHRKSIKKPFTELSAKMFLNLVEECSKQGLDVISMINSSIIGGYPTIYPPKPNRLQSKNKAAPENFAQKDYGQSTFTGGF